MPTKAEVFDRLKGFLTEGGFGFDVDDDGDFRLPIHQFVRMYVSVDDIVDPESDFAKSRAEAGKPQVKVTFFAPTAKDIEASDSFYRYIATNSENGFPFGALTAHADEQGGTARLSYSYTVYGDDLAEDQFSDLFLWSRQSTLDALELVQKYYSGRPFLQPED